MTTLFRRSLTAFSLTAICTTALVQAPLQADAAAPAASARNLDLTASDTQPLADGLAQDLGPLLASAQYRRDKDAPAAPEHSLTSVRHIAEALRTYHGVAYVALAERVDGSDSVQLRALSVLEGAPIGGAASPASGPSNIPGRGAIDLDLTDKSAQPLLSSLNAHLGALLPPAGAGTASKVEEIVAALEGQRRLAFVVLVQRAGEGRVSPDRVFVAPDVVRISIKDDAAAVPAGEAPEVELVPSEYGGPPLIKFEFDPEKYDVTKKK